MATVWNMISSALVGSSAGAASNASSDQRTAAGFSSQSTPEGDDSAMKPNASAPADAVESAGQIAHFELKVDHASAAASNSSMPPPPARTAAANSDAGDAKQSQSPVASDVAEPAAAELSTFAAPAPRAGLPRKKVVLEPGHSQMDWFRLMSKLPQQQFGKFTLDDVAKHNKKDDAWMVVRGRVYNVTPYMKFHPGGEL